MVVGEALQLWDRHEVLILLEELTGKEWDELLLNPGLELTEEVETKLILLLECRKNGEPLQYLIGKWWFYGLELELPKPVLIPRPETELLVEQVLAFVKAGDRVLDLCTGSGAIALALAMHAKETEFVATDISEDAVLVAEHNRMLFDAANVSIIQGNLYEAVGDERFHIIVSNPPYISTEDMKTLDRELSFEPHLALWGGDDGLDFYRKIVRQAPEHLLPGGRIFLEIGHDQGEVLRYLLAENGFTEIEVIKDYNEQNRIVRALYNRSEPRR